MYLIYCLSIWLLVFTCPALALFPKLVCSPKTAFAIPIVSTFCIYLLVSALLLLNLFTHESVIALSVGLGVITLWRLKRIYHLREFQWRKQDLYLYGLIAILLIPYMVKLGTHGFERGDEIYSWNFWAIQHYFQEAIDFSHTGAPYPQLFPKLLAYGYQLLGNIELQLPLKATLVIFPYTLLAAIAVATRSRPETHLAKFLFWTFYVLVLVGLEQFFDDGYADPLMSSSMVVSFALFWLSQRAMPAKKSSERTLMLIGASICAVTCAHAKQAGLLYALFAFPVMMCWQGYRQRAWLYWVLSAAVIVACLLWIFSEGRQFHQNQGVLWLSIGNRDLGQQLLYAVNRYFVQKPWLFLLFALSSYFAYRQIILRQLLFTLLIPGIVCWFLFGAYQLRLGQHLIAIAFFIVVAHPWTIPPQIRSLVLPMQLWIRHKPGYLLASSAVGSLLFGAIVFTQEFWLEKGITNIYSGGRQCLSRYFGTDTDKIYHEIYAHSEVLLWVPSRYLYGLFYHHTRLTTPDYAPNQTYNTVSLVAELRQKQPDYVFTVSEDIIDGPASATLKQVISQCPTAFEVIAEAPNRFSFVTYKINKPILSTDPCLEGIERAILPSAIQHS